MDLNHRKATGEDRISNLPESLIHHILAFLEFKHVAQTRVLSKRWSYIWTSVPILDFVERAFYDPDSSHLQAHQFMDFVDGTLLGRDKMSDIHKFSLTQLNPLNEYRVSSWITNVTKRNVQELILSLSQEDPFIVPMSLCTCVSLISLEIGVTPSIRFPKFSFSKLKRLVLKGFQFSNECWNEKFFSECPVLEYLILEQCTYGVRNFYISSGTLKLLDIYQWEDSLRNCALKLHAPNLVYLNYRGRVAREFVLPNSPKLVDANVYFFEEHVATREQRISYGTSSISQFLRALTHVKRLAVSDATLEVLSFADNLLENLPTFYNTKQLVVTVGEIDDKAVIALLKAIPNLESLIFDMVPPCSDDEEEDDVGGDDVGGELNYDNLILGVVTSGCLFVHLKSVCFNDFTATPREIKWMQLL